MKNKIDFKFLTLVFISSSLLCSLLLFWHGNYHAATSIEQSVVEAYVSENSFVTEITIVKEVLKSIFNVVRMS